MERKNKTRLGAIAIMLIIAIGNFTRIIKTDNIRTVEVLYIFTIGALSGVLFTGIIIMIMNRDKK